MTNPAIQFSDKQSRLLREVALNAFGGKPVFNGKLPEPYENKVWTIGKCRIEYWGVDEDAISVMKPEDHLRLPGPCGGYYSWISENHFRAVLKAGEFEDEKGRWSRWDYYGSLENIIKFPKSPSSSAFWQMIYAILLYSFITIKSDAIPELEMFQPIRN